MATASASGAPNQILKAAGLHLTRPRQALLDVMSSEHGPFTPDEIHRKLKRRADLATVYRGLAAFEASGLVRRCDFGDGLARYEWSGESDHHHHHVICRACKSSQSLEDCVPRLQEIQAELERVGYREVSHRMEFFGLCPTCAALKKPKAASPSARRP